MKRKEGVYSISVVAKMFSVHQQTIRMYEKEGLICPKRSSGNTRLFSEDDVDRLEEIIRLTHKMGVNLAGVEMVLKLQKRMKKMQDEMNGLFEQMSGQLDKEVGEHKTEIKKDVQNLLSIKREAKDKCLKSVGKEEKREASGSSSGDGWTFSGIEKKEEKMDAKSVDDWEVEYEIED